MGSPSVTEVEAILSDTERLDDESFSVLYRHYRGPLEGYANRHGATDPDGAANLALFAAFRAFNRRAIRSEAAFRSYLYRAVQSRTIDELRRPVAVPTAINEEELALDDIAESVVDRAWLGQLIDQLPPGQREVIEGRFLSDLTAEEVGLRLGKEPNAVHQTQHRAIRRLRRAVFAATVTVSVLLALLAWRTVAGGPAVLDTSPAELPDPTAESTPDEQGIGEPPNSEQPPPGVSPQPLDLDDGAAIEAGGLESTIEGTVDAAADAEGSPGAGATTVPTIEQPGPTLADNTSDGSAPTTTVPLSNTTTEAPPASAATAAPSAETRLSYCSHEPRAPYQGDWFYYAPSLATAQAFVPPAAITHPDYPGRNFVDEAGWITAGTARVRQQAAELDGVGYVWGITTGQLFDTAAGSQTYETFTVTNADGSSYPLYCRVS